MVMPIQKHVMMQDSPDAGFKPSGEEENKDAEDLGNESGNPSEGKDSEVPIYGCADDQNIPDLEEISRFSDAEDDGLDLPPPLKGSISKPKRFTRSSKPAVSIGLKKFRNVSNRMGKRNKGVEGMNEDRSYGKESRDEGVDAYLVSITYSDAQSLDARSCGEGISEKEVQVNLGEDLNGGLDANIVKGNDPHGINANVFLNCSEDIGPIPVPVSENPVLRPRVSPVVSPKILKRGEVFVDGGGKVNATFSFNNVEKWPNLSPNKGCNIDGYNSGVIDDVMEDVPARKKHVSFINAVQGLNKSGSNKLKLIPVCMNDQGKKVVDMDPLVEKGSRNWNMTLVGYFMGFKMSHREILGHLRRMWRAYHLDEIIMNDYGLYFLKFKSDEGISRISSMIGNPIIMDIITTEICEKSYGRASFARVLIEIDAEVRLSKSIKVWHVVEKCLIKAPVVTELKQMMGVNIKKTAQMEQGDNGDGRWKSVNSRRYGRNEGGNRGDQRFSKNEGSYYVLVKRNRVSRPINAKETNRNRKGKSKVDEGGSSKDSVGINEMDSETTNVGGRNVNKGDGNNRDGKNVNASRGGSNENSLKGVGYQNMFSAQLDEAEIERRLEWESMKERIDESCEQGLRIS
ncbi:hypothetical protein Tco_1267936 [Tanacetum coccineum]